MPLRSLRRARTETEWFRICWQSTTAMLFMANLITSAKPDEMPCHTLGGKNE